MSITPDVHSNQALSIHHALVSVFDKTNLNILAQFFCQTSINVISTGGTAQYLKERGVNVIDSDFNGLFPEMLDGRVKTLNPHIFGGILFDRSKQEHQHTIAAKAMPIIDLVVVNFYPFIHMAQNPELSPEQLIEFIDIGGPSMLRAASKNAAYVTALSEPQLYNAFIEHYKTHGGTTLAFRQARAFDVFCQTAHYDHAIAKALQSRMNQGQGPEPKPALKCTAPFSPVVEQHPGKQLRYGENPHQKARLYPSALSDGDINLFGAESLQGKELSYNNLLDTHAAIWALRCLAGAQFENSHYAVVIKHGVPCGAACAAQPEEALRLALASDPKSAFGGIIALSSIFDDQCLWALGDNFSEIIIAPSFSHDALLALGRRKNLRLLPIPQLMTGKLDSQSSRSIFGGILVQDQDKATLDTSTWDAVTTQKPHDDDLLAMKFAFSVAKTTPSNAITLAYSHQLIGVGAGQPNRLQSLEIALACAKERGFSLKNAALASDAFFPFEDCLTLAAEHGIRLIVQPGGSIKDADIIAHANKLNLAMVFTHERHFRH